MRPLAAIVLVASLVSPGVALADDAGDGGEDAGPPLACDGGLCDTTNGASCEIGRARGPGSSTAFLLVALAFATVMARRRVAVVVTFLLATALGSVAKAAPPAPVDVVIREEPPVRRYVSVAWNPVPVLALGKASFDVIVAPLPHHAIILSPFYTSTSTAPVYTFDNAGNTTQVPQQRFEGFGAELGYRYYFGQGGLRGVFLGPSFMLGSFTATAQDTTKTQFLDYGFAVDAGYQVLVADRVLVSGGLGAQYTLTDKTIPNQQFPSTVYANTRLLPRLLLSIGWAF